jgi:anthranilate synthase component 1
MLVDLGKTDLGKVCTAETIKVTDLMAIEKYSHVMHIVSNVEGTLKPKKGATDLLTAAFPAGTVSGPRSKSKWKLSKSWSRKTEALMQERWDT